ncbi:hypothetical protein KI387_034975, partial [Taxus chinensis]
IKFPITFEQSSKKVTLLLQSFFCEDAIPWEEVSPINDSILHFQLGFTATFFAGLFHACLNVLRLAFVIDFLSPATIVGFMADVAVISQKKTKDLWISAAAPFTSAIVAIAFGYITIIGCLKKELNPPSSNMLHFDSCYLALALKAGLVSGLIALTEGIAVARTFASIKDYQVDGNKEMMAIAFMNMAGSCTPCYVTS